MQVGRIPLPPPNLGQATDRMTEIDLCPIEGMEYALDRNDQAAMSLTCQVPSANLWLLWPQSQTLT
jgi:hypothetical protein